jgi:hypothetical protein
VRVEAHDRKRLEQLSRYITRPALSDERVQLDAAGQVELRLKTPWRDGMTHLVMGPLKFMQRLAPPRVTASRRPILALGSPLWVVHCRPWTSAIRWPKLWVGFPAVRSLTRLSLADPEPKFASPV